MEITWIGHSSFLIKDSKGRKLLTDPFDPTVGYDVYNKEADIVTISHHHFDHDYINEIKGSPEVIDKVGNFYVQDIPITGIPSFHDKMNGSKRGTNTIYVFEMDSLRLCHLGDLGHLLTEDILKQIGTVDILFIPVGGNFTIDGKEAAEVAKSIKSHIVIPMHFKTHNLNLDISGVEDFIIHMKNCEKVESSTIKIDEVPKEYNSVKVLNI